MSRENLLKAIDGLSDEQLAEPGAVGDWSVMQILFHMSMWEAELVKLLYQVAQGSQPTTAHFSKDDVETIHANWMRIGHTRSPEQMLDDFAAVRKQTTRRVSAFSDADLADPQRYPWLQGRPLWDWIGESSFQHEAEHAAQIRAWRSSRGY